MYNYSKIMDDCICIVHQCNSGNLSWVKLTLLFLQCTSLYLTGIHIDRAELSLPPPPPPPPGHPHTPTHSLTTVVQPLPKLAIYWSFCLEEAIIVNRTQVQLTAVLTSSLLLGLKDNLLIIEGSGIKPYAPPSGSG